MPRRKYLHILQYYFKPKIKRISGRMTTSSLLQVKFLNGGTAPIDPDMAKLVF
jgi:hypothetical protein